MLDFDIALRDVFYLIFGIVALLGVIYGINSGKKKDTGDERERLVRIDENLKEMRSDVADIKAEMRQTRTTLSEHERRLIKVEESQSTMWNRIDEIKDNCRIKTSNKQ